MLSLQSVFLSFIFTFKLMVQGTPVLLRITVFFHITNMIGPLSNNMEHIHPLKLPFFIVTLYFLPLLKLVTAVPGDSSPFRKSLGTRGCFLAFFLLAPHLSKTMTSSPILAATAQLQAARLLQDRKNERICKQGQQSGKTISYSAH